MGEDDELTGRIIGAAIEVHRLTGPGLLESTYQACLCHELLLREIPFRAQVALPLEYKQLRIPNAYRIDILVADAVIVELKSVEKLLQLHETQVMTYLRLSGLARGLLMNFNAVPLKSGIRRLVNPNPSLVSRTLAGLPTPL